MKKFAVGIFVLGALSGAIQASAELSARDVTMVEAVLRMQEFDLNSSKNAQEAVERYLDDRKGTAAYFDLIARFEIRERVPELVRMADGSSSGLRALNLALKLDGFAVRDALADDHVAGSLVQALKATGNPNYTPWIEAISVDETRPEKLRNLAGSLVGKEEAVVPTAKPLPDLAGLLKEVGEADSGKAVYARSCGVCHLPSPFDIDFGPNLSEIGDKLPKEDHFRSILEPNAAVSMGFEGYDLKLANGGQVAGLIPSETDDELTLLMMGGVRQILKKEDVLERTQLTQSLMPVGLHESMSRQDLVDLVAYLSTLKKN
jgi:putative heme-binding domain-containing protein